MPEIGKIRLDDTPVNGQLERGITSNWAYDHAHDPDGHGNDLYPWYINIDPFSSPKAQTGWPNISIDSNQIKSGYNTSSGAQNDEITWDVVLAAGTWKVTIVHIKGSSYGIFSIQFDSVEKATVDSYKSTTQRNVVSQTSNITVAKTAKIELKIKMATKNDSSSGYLGAITALTLIRTS